MKSILLIPIEAVLVLGQTALVFAQTAPIKPPPQPASFDCSADGTVVNSITGEPIVRAHVTLTSGGVAWSTATDSSGKWTLSGLGCATGQLQANRPGFIATPGNGTTMTMVSGAFQTVSLVSGSPVHSIGTELTPQTVAMGRVLDDQGDPVMDAQVSALASRVVDGKSRFQRVGFVRTNDLGEYRIAGLPRGKYVVCVHIVQPNLTVQSGSQTIMADTCSPGPVEGGLSSAMELPAGRETKVDFTLQQVVPVHVRGSVSGFPEGRGAGLRLVRQAGIQPGEDFPGVLRDGKFDFRVPPGSYLLTANYFEVGNRLFARVPVDAGSSDIENLVVHLETGFPVTGIVRAASQTGRKAAQQFGINLRSSETGAVQFPVKWDASHSLFAINDVTPGTYRLDIAPPAPFYVKSATLAGQDVMDVEMPISQAAGPIEIVLADDGGSIEGDVVDANGQPAAAGVMLLRNTIRAAGVATQSNGHFKLQNLAPGDYSIYAWDDPDEVEYADQDWMRRNAASGTVVTVTSGQSQQIKLIIQLVPAS